MLKLRNANISIWRKFDNKIELIFVKKQFSAPTFSGFLCTVCCKSWKFHIKNTNKLGMYVCKTFRQKKF